jgi:hypothetical protein
LDTLLPISVKLSILVDDLISSEEAQDVVVVLEALDNTEDLLVVDVLDVSNPLAGGYLDRSAPWTTYSAIYYKQVFGVIALKIDAHSSWLREGSRLYTRMVLIYGNKLLYG